MTRELSFEEFQKMSPEQQKQFFMEKMALPSARQPQESEDRKQYFKRYVEKECKSEEEKQKLEKDVESFWSRLKEYATENNRAYGLAVGRVQSGKTRNYIGLIFKAIDDGYNTIIVLTSKSNPLAKQTHQRVREWFGRQNGLDISTSNFLTQEADEKGIRWNGGEFSASRINVGVIIKNIKGHLGNLKAWLANITPEDQKSMKLLFIDDESDAATPNSNNVSEPEITSDADVRNLSARIKEESWSQAPDDSDSVDKYAFAADWVKSLNASEKLSDCDVEYVCDLLNKYTEQKNLFDMLFSDNRLQRILMLDSETQIGTGSKSKVGIINDVFNRRDTKNASLDWKDLRDYLNYVFGVVARRSKINNAITEIVSTPEKEKGPLFTFGKLIYVGYTATPFANLLNEDPTKDPLCPDCIKPLSPSSKYFGLERIYGVDRVYGDDNRPCNMNIVRTICEREHSGWVSPVQTGTMGSYDGEGLIREYDFANEKGAENIEWKSLKDAIKWAFCTAAARRVMRKSSSQNNDDSVKVDKKYRWTTMLFNISHLANQDNGVHKVQKEIVEHYVHAMLSQDRRDEFLKECMNIWREETAAFSAEDFNKACPEYGKSDIAYPSESQVETALRDWFLPKSDKVRVIQMNSASKDQDQTDYNDPNCGGGGDVLWIVCGGNAISRGLTLDGLTVSYFDRIKRSTAVDTITQMGRWFGYRLGYELLPRIWMTDETIAEMKNICRIESQLHDELYTLFYDEDKTSIRKGRNVANIRYFGRRLSGRDANGIKIDGIETRGVLDYVAEDPTATFDDTSEFIRFKLGLGNIWHKQPFSDYTKALHNRHKYIWTGVKKELVRDYLSTIKDELGDSSRGRAQALIREIDASFDDWNVVIGCPYDTTQTQRFKTVTGIEGLKDVLARNNTIESRVDGCVRTGHGTQTVEAYLSLFPGQIIDEAAKTAKKDGNVDGKKEATRYSMETVNAAYKIAKEAKKDKEEKYAHLLHPVLLIDFVNGDQFNGGQHGFYVQVSFYWYGHNANSYFRALINPKRPSYVADAVEIIKEKPYVLYNILKQKLEEKYSCNFDKKQEQEFLDELKCTYEKAGSPVQICWSKPSKKAESLPTVIYDKKWMSENTEAYMKGMRIFKSLGNMPDKETRKEAKKEAIVLFRTAAAAGYPLARVWLGREYECVSLAKPERVNEYFKSETDGLYVLMVCSGDLGLGDLGQDALKALKYIAERGVKFRSPF